ncbi:TRAP transporter small permease [Bradyrhizobium sp. LHD-71]|uniref:TRAP transporter small permease subunit n=1 Tax=Bradyrhizobium sp. LHD-71 TaxID=3072141 RepID=UPI00280FC545|nr:TRAP transporter small permease [Bradyrhizobium sp. LHD-71]MDQ8729185.1 TRAP transporter small permease [Bradyrhizobium sp. LHD-71]
MSLHSATVPPAPVLFRVNRWLSWLENTLTLCAAAAIFFLMLVAVFQILSRTLFGTAIYGYIDYIEQASPIFALLGVSYCQRLGAHVRMDLILRGLPKRLLWAMEGLAVLVAIAIITLLVDSTFDNFLRAWYRGDSSMDIRLPVWPSKLMVPFALSVLWVRLLLQTVDYARLVVYPDAVPIAVPMLETPEEQARTEIEEALGREGRTGT